MKLSIALAILLIVSHAATSVAAQAPSPPDEEEGQVCILIAYGWNGSPTEIKQIKDIPVPRSYVTKKGGACGGYVTADHLIRWHLRYGDEYTVEKALEFIEKRDGRVETLASKLGRELINGIPKAV
ncbi:MAG: hypothetical protein ABL928_15575 [Sphingorhabdus sp.]